MSVILITIRNNTGYLAKREHDRLTNAVWNISPTDIENDTISLMEARTSDTGKPLVVNRGTRTLTYNSNRFQEPRYYSVSCRSHEAGAFYAGGGLEQPWREHGQVPYFQFVLRSHN